MKKDILRLTLCLTMAGIPSLRAGEASPGAGQVTPEILVRQALARNPEVNFYAAGIAAAKGSLKTAGTVRNPELNTQAGYKNTRDASGATLGDGAAWSLSVSQTLEYPGRIALRKAIATGDIEVAQLHFEQFRLTLAARVRALAYSVVIAQEKAAASQEVAGRFVALHDVMAQREPAGVTPLLEARIIDANTFSLGRQAREAALAEKNATAELNQLRGQPASSPLRIDGGQFAIVQTSLPTLLAGARTRSFDIRIRQAELAQQGFKIALSRNERYPAIEVGPFYSQENAADKEQQVGVGLSVPLPFWDRNAGNIEANKARAQQAQASLLMAERDVERRVAQNAATLEAKRDEMDKWQGGMIAQFRETAELADRNYRSGAVSLPTYVETQKQYLEVLGAVHDTKKEALQAAQELEILTGMKLYKFEPLP